MLMTPTPGCFNEHENSSGSQARRIHWNVLVVVELVMQLRGENSNKT